MIGSLITGLIINNHFYQQYLNNFYKANHECAIETGALAVDIPQVPALIYKMSITGYTCIYNPIPDPGWYKIRCKEAISLRKKQWSK